MSRSFTAVAGALAVVAVLPAQDAATKRVEFPYSMDFGPCLTTTLQSRGTPGVTHKALVIRLDGGAAAFDTELLRMSSIWTDGWLELRGTAYDGAHGPMPRLQGRHGGQRGRRSGARSAQIRLRPHVRSSLDLPTGRLRS